MQTKLSIYLAGPVSNCNETQKLRWRKDIRRELKEEFDFIDPTEKQATWDPKDEIVDIDRADVVIANLWRESIGTVIGIIQARRRGKPVILIDPNFIKSKPLEAFVGPDCITTSVKGATNKLREQIAPELTKAFQVLKKGKKKPEAFSQRKLQNSINAACDDARISDALFPIYVAKGAVDLLRKQSRTTHQPVTTDDIRKCVFDFLETIADPKDELYHTELKASARHLMYTWELQEVLKTDVRSLQDLKRENEELAVGLREKDEDIAKLKGEIEYLSAFQKPAVEAVSIEASVQQPPSDIRELLIRRASENIGQLVVHNSALSSCETCPKQLLPVIDKCLAALVAYSAALQSGLRPGDLGKWLNAHECAVSYSPRESRTTRNNGKLLSDRTITVEGKKHVLENHIKLGRYRMYFDVSSTNKIILGHIGKHLKTSAHA